MIAAEIPPLTSNLMLSLTKAGNKRFRDFIDKFAPHYVNATTKLEKSQVIAAVISKVRSDTPAGEFVKKDFYSGRWYDIGNERARDKVGHAIRKAAEELQKQKGNSSGSSSRRAKKTLVGNKSSPMQKGKSSPQPSMIQPPFESESLHSMINPQSTLSSLYAEDRVFPSFARTAMPYFSQNMMADERHIMPGLAPGSSSVIYAQAPQQQSYMANLRALSSVADSKQLQTMMGTTAGGGGGLRGLGETKGAAVLTAPSGDASSISNSATNRLAALRDIEMQHALSASYSNRSNRGGLLPLASNITRSFEALMAQRNQRLAFDSLLGNAPIPEANNGDHK
jgi:hypothetical protein